MDRRYRPDERNISFSFARLFFLPFASAVRLIERGREEPCHCQTGVAFQSPAPIPVFLFILRAESSFWASSSKHLLYIVSFYFTNDQTEKEKKIPMQSLIRQREWFDDFSLFLSLISQLQSKVKLKALHRDLDIYTCTYVSRKGRKEGDAIKTRVIIRDYAGIFRVEWHAGGGVVPAFVNRTSRAHPLNSIRFALIFSYTPAR